MKALAGSLLILAFTIPVAARAQRLQFTVGGVAAQEIVQSHVDASSDRFTGLVLGAEGGLVNDRFVVRLRYGQGRVNPKNGDGLGGSLDSRDVVEGEALFGFRALPWLTLLAGPSARAYTMGDIDERWLIWTGRVSARGELLPGRMQSFVEVWGALSGNVGDPALKARGRGANGGLEVHLGERALWGRLGYRIESTHAEGLRETVESLTLSLIYGLPQ
ncbi:MAG: hypothetical protein ABR537_01360 [Gemmatimonadales bacterium]